MNTKNLDMINKISQEYESKTGKKPDNNLIKMIIEATLEQIKEINDSFIGHRIGEIDLNSIYNEQFNVNTKKTPKIK